MARTGIYYEKKWLWGDNSVNIQVHCPFHHCYLSINQVSFQSLLYFQRYGPDKVPDGQTDKEAFHSGEHKNVTYEFIERGNILF